jgi:peptidoglycan hydrolase CwlO-like protein
MAARKHKDGVQHQDRLPITPNESDITDFMNEVFELDDQIGELNARIKHLKGNVRIKQIRINSLHAEIRKLFEHTHHE